MTTSSTLIRTHRRILLSAVCILALSLLGTYVLYRDAMERYDTLLSVVIFDRKGIPITTEQNAKGHYAYTLTSLPPHFKTLLIQKEDHFFYYHPGINPISTLRALMGYVKTGSAGGSSTITQQLAKNLLATESTRTLKNKLKESIYAVSIELFTDKDELLNMYANTVFLGNQVQGFETGSRAYFNKPLDRTTPHEQIALLATLSHPSSRNPWQEANTEFARALYTRLALPDTFTPPLITKGYAFQATGAFELTSAGITCTSTCITTLDVTLMEQLRAFLALRIEEERERGARNGAIVVIDAHTEELLALVGSPDPSRESDGGKINMALAPRPIGSTIKPFIYLRGFMDGLRPYTLVDDREYKYPIATGFSLYPKNFDGAYHGIMTLHSALSNSYNVPTVKVLEYIGLAPFYTFLEDALHFTPIAPLDSYQYGIALGGLEMDLLTLTHYFTLFPRGGTIAPLDVHISTLESSPALPPQSTITKEEHIASPAYVALVHKIISDRITGVDQFGLKSNLNLTIPEYGVKTGTSRDFHDSWVVGYTPDLVVGVWLGNSENEPLLQISGGSGAGMIWHDAMEYLATTPYYRTRIFPDSDVRGIPIGNSIEWGLPEDTVQEHERILLSDSIIVNPHENDTFELHSNTTIPLRAREIVSWSVDGIPVGTGTEIVWQPTEVGTYTITATNSDTMHVETVSVVITPPSQ